ncbi:hypothetical protein [Serratia fonticola]|uniref:hypothetical protein n=1 Tax=Serratia fonticola TaxID=47917 RepID=UPI00217A76CC|nr:hypothetical protein [Serratia fonticola]CAI1587297.1 Uncharacterised protein [Serratia fonticola]CAI1749348.1 Uncharacterised protein [Serratia fonticola]CAI1782186.1 Uncharacterised protein [Serratia fonticola]
MTNLESIFKRFMAQDRTAKNLDDYVDEFLKPSGGQYQRADYLLDNSLFIIELKSIDTDPTPNVQQKINKMLETDEWLRRNFWGTVHIEELISKHPNAYKFRRELMDVAYRNIKQLIRSADKQIASTKQCLNLNESIGGLVILNDNIKVLEADTTADAIEYSIVNSNYKNVEFVIYIYEALEKETNAVNVIGIVDGESPRVDFIKWYISNVFSFNWSSFTGRAISR